jgi:hypothetical protein
MTRGACGRPRTFLSSSIPSTLGMRRSEMTSWNGSASIRSSAAAPSAASLTSIEDDSRISRSV